MASAAFTIDSTAVPQSSGEAVATSYGATVSLALSSVVGANSIRWTIVGTSAPDVATPTITPAGVPLGATATFTVGADAGYGDGVAYAVRCQVRDGGGGMVESFGIVGVRNSAGVVPAVAGEEGSWRHETHGWTDLLNQALKGSGGGGISVLAYGADPTGATDSTAAIQEAIDACAAAGGGEVYLPAGTYLVSASIALASKVSLRGGGADATTIRLADGSNVAVIDGNDSCDLALRDFAVDGNKANQTPGTALARGIYLHDQCYRLHLENVNVVDILDHGIMISPGDVPANETGRESVLINCRAYNCGSAAHSAAGGPGGTGINPYLAICYGCYSSGNQRCGFKSSTLQCVECVAEDCVGNGFETGFGSPDTSVVSLIGCRAMRCSDGFRNQGQADFISLVGCLATENYYCGYTFLAHAAHASIVGCRALNNGQGGSRVVGDNGIDGLWIGSVATAPGPLSVVGCVFADTQGVGSETQEYGIYIEAAGVVITEAIDIDASNQAAGNKLGAIRIASRASNITVRGFSGMTGRGRNSTPVTVTATTAITEMMRNDIAAGELHIGSRVRVSAAGRCSGTAGTKAVRLRLGSGSVLVSSQAAGEEQDWAFTADLFLVASTKWMGTIQYTAAGGTKGVTQITASIGSTTDVVLYCSGQLGDAADSIIQDFFSVVVEE